jgi:hypothetical protein
VLDEVVLEDGGDWDATPTGARLRLDGARVLIPRRVDVDLAAAEVDVLETQPDMPWT